MNRKELIDECQEIMQILVKYRHYDNGCYLAKLTSLDIDFWIKIRQFAKERVDWAAVSAGTHIDETVELTAEEVEEIRCEMDYRVAAFLAGDPSILNKIRNKVFIV